MVARRSDFKFSIRIRSAGGHCFGAVRSGFLATQFLRFAT